VESTPTAKILDALRAGCDKAEGGNCERREPIPLLIGKVVLAQTLIIHTEFLHLALAKIQRTGPR
jgi:hypothetical protein